MSGKTITSRLIVSLLDGVSGPAAKAGAALTALKNRAAFSVGAGMTGIQGAMAGVTAGAKKASAAIDKVNTAVQPVALASLFGFYKAYEFEKAVNAMEFLGEMTKVQRKEAEAYIKVLSQQYPRSLVKLAETWNELLRGGLSFNASKGALGSTMALAIAGDIDPKQASEIAINALNQFRMPMETVEQASASMKKVADVITYAANKSATDVRLMGETFKYAAPMATALGMSMNELAAMSMIMANNGIKGSEAGVAIRSAMVRLLKPTKDMRAELARLNINADDFMRKGRAIGAGDVVKSLGFDGIKAEPFAAQIEKALADPVLKAAPQRLVAELTKIISDGLGSSSVIDKKTLSDNLTDTLTAATTQIDLFGFIKAIRDKAGPGAAAAVARIFDVRQGSRLLTLMAGDVGEALLGVQNSAGYAEKGAATMLQGTVGAVERLGTALEALYITISQSGVFDAIAEGAKAATSFLQRMSESSPALLKYGTYALMAVAGLSVLKVAVTAAAGALSLLRIGLAAIATSLGIVVAGLGTLAYFNWDGIKARASAFANGFGEGWASKIAIPDSVRQSWSRFSRELDRTFGVSIDLTTWRDLGHTLGTVVAAGVNALASAFGHLCDGMTKAMQLASSVRNALTGIGSLQAPGGVQSGLPKGFSAPGRAAGGSVTGGKPYMVGEVGPELFVPRSSGTIIPNGAKLGGGGSVTLSPVFNFHGVNTSDPREMARTMRREFENFVNETFRGAQADVGLRWT